MVVEGHLPSAQQACLRDDDRRYGELILCFRIGWISRTVRGDDLSCADADRGALEHATAAHRLILVFEDDVRRHICRGSQAHEIQLHVGEVTIGPDINQLIVATADWIEGWAAGIAAKHVLFLFDSCFSGMLFARERGQDETPIYISHKTAQPVRHFITSGDADERVPDDSIFRDRFVDALEGNDPIAEDGYVTGAELAEFLYNEVVALSGGRQHPQSGKTRIWKLNRGDFVFLVPEVLDEIRRSRPDPDSPPRDAAAGDEWVHRIAGVYLTWRYIQPGSFMMGSPVNEDKRSRDEARREMTLSHGFWMAETEVTQGQWKALMGKGNNPSEAKSCPDECPVERVSWYDAVAFANELSELSGLETCYDLSQCSGRPGRDGQDSFDCPGVSPRGSVCGGYRLATEAEWEYAARAGTTTSYWMGPKLPAGDARFDPSRSDFHARRLKLRGKEIPKGPVKVRSYAANPWGLYEVHGNVKEWVEDAVTYDVDEREVLADAILGGPHRGIRGGSWYDRAHYCRSANRYAAAPGLRRSDLGFRLVRTAPAFLEP